MIYIELNARDCGRIALAGLTEAGRLVAEVGKTLLCTVLLTGVVAFSLFAPKKKAQ